uniref:GOLD domain-containing protein n=1 Tax=Ascaris lumbricoides TaxID=6252 RepID=A0A0M3HKG3_ASCLU
MNRSGNQFGANEVNFEVVEMDRSINTGLSFTFREEGGLFLLCVFVSTSDITEKFKSFLERCSL